MRCFVTRRQLASLSEFVTIPGQRCCSITDFTSIQSRRSPALGTHTFLRSYAWTAKQPQRRQKPSARPRQPARLSAEPALVNDPATLNRVLEFRQAFGDNDLNVILQEYPVLAESGLLEPQDSAEIMRGLHNASRAQPALIKPEKLKEHVDTFLQLYRSRRIPAHPTATLHLISYFNRTGQVEVAVDFWNWVVAKGREEYIDLRVYGAVIELQADHGMDLQLSEDTYLHGIRRFPMQFNEYQLTHNAVLDRPDLPTITSGTSMTLLQGIIKARLRAGDWQNAYLGLDTALRLHPAELPPYLYRIFDEERPHQEALQVFYMLCRSGSRVPQSGVVSLLNRNADLHHAVESGDDRIATLTEGVRVVQAAIASRQALDHIPFSILLQRGTDLLTSLDRASLNPKEAAEVHVAGLSTAVQVTDLLKQLSIKPEPSFFNNMITIAGKLQNPLMLEHALEGMKNWSIVPNKITFKMVLIAAGQVGDDQLIREWWPLLFRRLLHADDREAWRVFASSTAAVGQAEYYKEQVESLGLNWSEDAKGALLGHYEQAARRVQQAHAKRKEPLDSATSFDSQLKLADAFDAALKTFGTRSSAKGGSSPNEDQSPGQMIMARWWSQTIKPEILEDWQRNLYKEIAANRARGQGAPTQDIETDEPDLNSGNMAAGSEPSRPHLARRNLIPTGFTFEEIRFRNWAEVNNLLLQAHAYEPSLAAVRDEVLMDPDFREKLMAAGNPNAQINLRPAGSSVAAEQRRLMTGMQHTACARFPEECKRVFHSETTWRAMVLQLRGLPAPR